MYESVLFLNSDPSNAVKYTFKYIISWLNLDLGIETCFFNGMSAVSKTWLQFVFPFYLWFLVALIIYLCRVSSHVSRLIGSHAVPVLATMLLLSYMKLVRTIVAVFYLTSLTYSSCGNQQSATVWFVDAIVKYISWQHLLLLVSAIFIFIFLLIPYIVFLLTAPLIERYLSRYKAFRKWFKLKPLFDAYNGPYKDSYRFWTAILLLARLVLLLTVSFSTENTTPLTVLMSTVAILYTLSLTFGGVYRMSYLNFLEGWFYLHILVIAIVAATNGNQRITEIILMVSLILVYLTVIGVFIWHVVLKVKGSQWWKRKKATKMKRTVTPSCFTQLMDSDDVIVSRSTVSSLEIELEREPLIFDGESENY